MQSAFDGYRTRRTAEIEFAIAQSRLLASLNRWPKDRELPSVSDLLAKPTRSPRRTSAEMLAAFQEMQASGAPLRIEKLS